MWVSLMAGDLCNCCYKIAANAHITTGECQALVNEERTLWWTTLVRRWFNSRDKKSISPRYNVTVLVYCLPNLDNSSGLLADGLVAGY